MGNGTGARTWPADLRFFGQSCPNLTCQEGTITDTLITDALSADASGLSETKMGRKGR